MHDRDRLIAVLCEGQAPFRCREADGAIWFLHEWIRAPVRGSFAAADFPAGLLLVFGLALLPLIVVSLSSFAIPVEWCPKTIKPTLPASLAGGFRELFVSSYSAQRCPPGRDAHTSRTTTSTALSFSICVTLLMFAWR